MLDVGSERERDVQLDVGVVRGPHERVLGVDRAVVDRASLGLARHLHAPEPAGRLRRAFLLPALGPVDAAEVAPHAERPPAHMWKQHRCDSAVVGRQVGLREAGLRIEDTLRMGDLHARRVFAGGHGDPACARLVVRVDRFRDDAGQPLLGRRRQQRRAVATVDARCAPGRAVELELLEVRAPLAPRQRRQRMAVQVDDVVDLVEAVGQIGRFTHVVDRLPDGPVRRHRDILGLHPPTCGILRIQQAALERIALRRRQSFQNLFAVLLVESFQNLDGIVGFQFANAFRDRLGFEFFKDFLTDGVVDFVQRREVKIGAGEFHHEAAGNAVQAQGVVNQNIVGAACPGVEF